VTAKTERVRLLLTLASEDLYQEHPAASVRHLSRRRDLESLLRLFGFQDAEFSAALCFWSLFRQQGFHATRLLPLALKTLGIASQQDAERLVVCIRYTLKSTRTNEKQLAKVLDVQPSLVPLLGISRMIRDLPQHMTLTQRFPAALKPVMEQLTKIGSKVPGIGTLAERTLAICQVLAGRQAVLRALLKCNLKIALRKDAKHFKLGLLVLSRKKLANLMWKENGSLCNLPASHNLVYVIDEGWWVMYVGKLREVKPFGSSKKLTDPQLSALVLGASQVLLGPHTGAATGEQLRTFGILMFVLNGFKEEILESVQHLTIIIELCEVVNQLYLFDDSKASLLLEAMVANPILHTWLGLQASDKAFDLSLVLVALLHQEESELSDWQKAIIRAKRFTFTMYRNSCLQPSVNNPPPTALTKLLPEEPQTDTKFFSSLARLRRLSQNFNMAARWQAANIYLTAAPEGLINKGVADILLSKRSDDFARLPVGLLQCVGGIRQVSEETSIRTYAEQLLKASTPNAFPSSSFDALTELLAVLRKRDSGELASFITKLVMGKYKGLILKHVSTVLGMAEDLLSGDDVQRVIDLALKMVLAQDKPKRMHLLIEIALEIMDKAISRGQEGVQASFPLLYGLMGLDAIVTMRCGVADGFDVGSPAVSLEQAKRYANDQISNVHSLLTEHVLKLPQKKTLERIGCLLQLWTTACAEGLHSLLPQQDIEAIDKCLMPVFHFLTLGIALHESRLDECEDAIKFVASKLHGRLTGPHLKQLMLLCQRELDGASSLMSMLGLPRPDSLNSTKMLGILKRVGASRVPATRKLAKMHGDLLSSMSQATSNEQFVRSFDFDHSGTLDREEFAHLAAYYSVPKKVESAKIKFLFEKHSEGASTMSIVQARNALSDLDHDLFMQTLAQFGLSGSKIILKIAVLAAFLGAFATFILLGIAAFTQTSSFNSVINSVLAGSGIGGITASSVDDLFDSDMIDTVLDRISSISTTDNSLLPDDETDEEDE
jgi:hypothetical protein